MPELRSEATREDAAAGRDDAARAYEAAERAVRDNDMEIDKAFRAMGNARGMCENLTNACQFAVFARIEASERFEALQADPAAPAARREAVESAFRRELDAEQRAASLLTEAEHVLRAETATYERLRAGRRALEERAAAAEAQFVTLGGEPDHTIDSSLKRYVADVAARRKRAPEPLEKQPPARATIAPAAVPRMRWPGAPANGGVSPPPVPGIVPPAPRIRPPAGLERP